MLTSESVLAKNFADLINDMREKGIFTPKTTFDDIAEYSDKRESEKESEKINIE